MIILNNTEKNYIKAYIEPPQIPLTVQNIDNELGKKFWVRERKREIKRYLKFDLKYSFEKKVQQPLKEDQILLNISSLYSLQEFFRRLLEIRY